MATMVVPVTSKVSATLLGLLVQDGVQVINIDSASIIWVSGSPAVAVNYGTPLKPGACVNKQGDGPVYAILDVAATGTASLVVTDELSGFDSGAVAISGGTVTATLSGPVGITGTVTVAGTVNVGNTPTINVGAGNTIGITGTPTVNVGAGNSIGISGTPNVNISGGTVGISGTPAVSISGTPNVNVSTGTVNIGTVGSIVENTEILTDDAVAQYPTALVAGSSGVLNVSAFGTVIIKCSSSGFSYGWVDLTSGSAIGVGLLAGLANGIALAPLPNVLAVKAGGLIISGPAGQSYGVYANNRLTPVLQDNRTSILDGDRWQLATTAVTAGTVYPLTQTNVQVQLQGSVMMYTTGVQSVATVAGRIELVSATTGTVYVLFDTNQMASLSSGTLSKFLNNPQSLPADVYSIQFRCAVVGSISFDVKFIPNTI